MRIECENLLDDLEPLLHDIEAEWAEMTGLAAEHSRTNLNALIFSSHFFSIVTVVFLPSLLSAHVP